MWNMFNIVACNHANVKSNFPSPAFVYASHQNQWQTELPTTNLQCQRYFMAERL